MSGLRRNTLAFRGEISWGEPRLSVGLSDLLTSGASVSKRVLLTPRKRPSQERAQATWDAIVQAAGELLLTESAASLSTNRVAERAGVSVGTLYQYFPSKEAVLAEWVDARLSDDATAMKAMLSRPTEDLRQGVRLQVQHLCERQHAVAPIMREVLPLLGLLERDRIVQRLVLELGSALAEVFRGHPELRAELCDPERFELAVFVAVHAMRGALNAATIEQPELLLTAAFHDELTRIALRLLSADGPAQT